MEYSAHPARPDHRYTKFYIFDNRDTRVPGVELDGRGEKYVPNLCIVCHGGNTPQKPFGSGDVQAKFLPFDLESFKYSRNPSFTLQAQAAAFKALNIATLRTAPTESINELVEGWYGGPNVPGQYNKNFIPPGWSASAEARNVYSNVFKVSCRSCHVSRTGNKAFSDYELFKERYGTTMSKFICPPSPATPNASPTMPNALRTFNIFWSSQCGAVDQPSILRTNLGFSCGP